MYSLMSKYGYKMSIVSLIAGSILVIGRVTAIPTIYSKPVPLPLRRVIICTVSQRFVHLVRKGLLLVQRKIGHTLVSFGIELTVRIEG